MEWLKAIADKYKYSVYQRDDKHYQINGLFITFELDLSNGVDAHSFCLYGHNISYEDVLATSDNFLDDVKGTIGYII